MGTNSIKYEIGDPIWFCKKIKKETPGYVNCPLAT